MSTADRRRWDARHAVVDPAAPVPPDAVRGREQLVPTVGTALEVACGRGAVAAWLARRGLTVDAVDVSPVALAAAGAAEPSVRWIAHDLDAGLPEVCSGPYDVVVCQRFRDPALYPALRERLAPGGLLVITVLSEVGDGPGPFRARPGELSCAFADLSVLVDRERDGEACIVAVRAPRGSRPTPPAPS